MFWMCTQGLAGESAWAQSSQEGLGEETASPNASLKPTSAPEWPIDLDKRKFLRYFKFDYKGGRDEGEEIQSCPEYQENKRPPEIAERDHFLKQ